MKAPAPIPAAMLGLQASTIAPIRDLVRVYGRLYAADVWFWQRLNNRWEMVVGTREPASSVPGSEAVPVVNPGGAETCVEVAGISAEEAARGAAFLAVALGEALRHQNETRFFGREIAERYEEITLLYTISEILGSVISMEEAARGILGEIIEMMAVKRAALWIHDPELNTLRLVAAVGGEGRVNPISLDDAGSITASVFRNRQSIILDPDDTFVREAKDFGVINRESILSVPVHYTPPQGKARVIGVINLVGRRNNERFSAGDHKLITAIASQVGAAMENNRLVAESLRRERVDREMEIARDLQLKLLPSTERFRDRADVAARCVAADSVGGDFYHLFRLSGGRFGVVIGDVSSHGLGSALIMALTMSAVSISASEGNPPAEVLRRAHQALISELESTGMYLTLFYGVIDPLAGKLRYANAGHAHAFVVPADGTPSRLAVTNPPFGLVDVPDYDEKTVGWDPHSDLLLLFTDGLSDAISQSAGERAVVDYVARQREHPLDDIIESLFSIATGVDGIPPDDRTMVLVRV
ncbi:MAG: SpoIIE family protein phosphatase [Gemmatimonadota bacterium]|jgi:sigma-B regulation protein RsbU (phosphoserine phosphatase)|nr:SpoIIE family protein phosphatase [Gemmatimonadota bacterium]